jgi:hypothetical protein
MCYRKNVAMSIRNYINIVERHGIEESRMSSRHRSLAAVASLRRLLTQAGGEWASSMFQLEDAEKLGLRADFDRAKAADFIVFAANPDWWEPTERGLVAIKTLDKEADSLAAQKEKRRKSTHPHTSAW